MMRTLFFISTLLAASACERSSEHDSSSAGTSTPGTSTATPSTVTQANRPAENQPTQNPTALNAPASAGDQHAADNTGKNERDRSGATATSGDQSNSEPDLKLTQQVRKAIMDDDKLSMTAKNVKIIAKDGVVTLRGPVKSSQEKAQIDAIAKRTPDVKRVDNQLEIASK